METLAGAVRSLRFSKSGEHLFAGNEFGQIVVFDVEQAQAVDIIQTCQARAIWSIDVSWDDQVVAVGTEDATVELYSFTKILAQQPKQHLEQGRSMTGKSTSPAFLKVFKTKMNGILHTQFTWRNLLYTIGCCERNLF